MTESLPSSKTVLADIPEVESFLAEFHYNFFQPDERLNSSGKATKEFILKKPAESFDSAYIESDQFNRFTARYISFNWKPVINYESFKPPGFKIADNFNKIHEEQHFIGDNFSSLSFQDTGADEKISYYIKNLKEHANIRTDKKKLSPLDQSKELLRRVNGKIGGENMTHPELLLTSLNRPEDEGYSFLNDEGKKVNNPSILDELKDSKFFLHLNNKIIADAVRTVPENSFSIFQDEVEEIQNALDNIQTTVAATSSPANFIDAKDYELEIEEYINYRSIDPSGYEPRQEFVGYIIEKIEIDEDGNHIVQDPIFIENPNVNSAVDVNIKYGVSYKYSIRTIALFETIAESNDVDQGSILIQYLIASKPSVFKVVKCEEKVPPPPPSDIDIRWDGIKRNLCVEWCFPSNPQRDIKGWQIFRRASINEPFELQKFYDFDDSVVKTKNRNSEYVDEYLTEKMTSPKNLYIDLSFNKESKYIYTVCSVDARGYSSNYGIQFEVTFDKFRNKLVKKLISRSGAPKAYPNWYLNEDSFVDTMKDSGHKSCRVVFNPEYLDVYDSENNNLGLLKTKNDSSYHFNIINIDLQTQKNVEIKLKDMRYSADKNNDSIVEKRLLQNRRDIFDRFKKQRNRFGKL